MRIAIIGAGAAGCFCAIELKRRHPEAQTVIFEAGRVPLAKVALTGGGRCNFTNSFEDISDLREAYPRGAVLMKRALKLFSPQDCRGWFRAEGVESVVQPDRCVFPESQDAMQIVRTLEGLLRRGGVEILCGRKIRQLLPDGQGGWQVDGERFDKVVVTTGGGIPAFLNGIPLKTEKVVPSLFTLKIPCPELNALMGICVNDAILRIAGSPFRSEGILLLTDWGISGPATLKLSSYAARYLSENGYRCRICINWTGESEGDIERFCLENIAANAGKQLSSVHPQDVPDRLWRHLLHRASLREELRWGELGRKGIARLVSTISCDEYPVEGRARFKEEFVSCGGVSLSEVNPNTLEAKNFPGLYFAGEVLDIDAVTGGFNLQAAWATAMTVARSL